jgi:hypothetical protein
MLRRVLPWLVGIAVVVGFATPFAKDLYDRYQLQRELTQLSDPAALATLKQRYGSLAAVGEELSRRCAAIYGPGEPTCQRYRLALRD